MPSASKPPPGLLYIEDYEADDGTITPGIATRLGITPSTFRKWRMAGKGPRTFILSNKVTAREEAIDEYIAEREHIAEQERASDLERLEMRPPEPRTSRGRRRKNTTSKHPVTADV